MADKRTGGTRYWTGGLGDQGTSGPGNGWAREPGDEVGLDISELLMYG